MKRPIITVPSPLLRKRSKKASGVSPSLVALAKDMTDTLVAYDQPHEIGAALAAPQVGELVTLTVIRKDFEIDVRKLKHPEKNFFTVINPVIVASSPESATELEGCLSIPGMYGYVKRHKEVTVKGLDLTGRGVTITAKDFMARVFQHEIDHLRGILYTDRVENMKQLYRINKEGELMPENIEHREGS